MHQRISKRFHQVFIEIGFFTDQIQIDFFFKTTRQIAYHTRKTSPPMPDGSTWLKKPPISV